MANCERCIEKHDREREGTPQDYTGEVLCDDCRDTLAEAAHERFLEDYYGGSGPVTIQEQYDAAAKVKREQR
jgi:hypothetical protein